MFESNVYEYNFTLHMPIPQKICVSNKIGKTVYDVTANFNIDGKETILQQFKALILSAKWK